MRGILRHIKAIRAFLSEKTGGKWEDASDAVLRRLLTEAYNHVPILMPLRLILPADQFVDFLIEKRGDLFVEDAAKHRRNVKRRTTSARRTPARKPATRKTTARRKPTSRAAATRRTTRTSTATRRKTRT